LYDKVYRSDVLDHAYQCCRTNGGAEGVDGQRFEDIETYGIERWLGELAEELTQRGRHGGRTQPRAAGLGRLLLHRPGQ
jgi:hypothetical protein